VREIPLLRQLFPEAQIIHIVRDGRDVALSWLETRYEPMNMYKAARLWAEMVRRGRSDGSRLPASDYYEVRYETLLGEPEKTMRQVCEFLREPFDPAVLAPNRLKPGLRGARFDRDLVTQNTRIWQSSMSLRQRVLFESVAGDLLGELGYAVENGGTKLSATQRAWHETDHQLRHLALGLWNLRTPESRKKARTYGWAEMRRLLGGSRHRQRNRKIRRLNIRHYDSDAPPA
jgi:hypothetical protein